ncbi:hypothetical protein SteCoe_10546 [Stentor coeruleus]|uniref:Protein kinase domain-containing protein n=1 Tax=Stentor coeruleus TaxID=5963 RepID=A0A1R2CFA7_9CILI|nr:hypothetical protein SteCoe_10546 [Stentor coeruleus]
MGGACSNRKAVEVQVAEIKIEPIKRKEIINKDIEHIRKKKIQLFSTDNSESSFVELSTPRSGKLTKWRRGELIGEGAYAKVYQCINLSNGELLAVKHFALSDDPRKIEKDFLNMKKEVSLLRNLAHENIVQYYQTDLSEDMSGIDILLEYVPGGSLKRILQKFKCLEVPIIRKYARQLVLGLQYLHDNSIIHRDLKSANVLISPSGVLKLTDFGSSRKFDDLEEHMTKSLKGSPYWMAPEVVNRKGHNYSADIWSFGCVLIEMVTGHPPWSNYSHDAKEVLQLIAREGSYPDIPNCEISLKNTIFSCVQRDPKIRPTPSEILKMEFFMSIDNEDD